MGLVQAGWYFHQKKQISRGGSGRLRLPRLCRLRMLPTARFFPVGCCHGLDLGVLGLRWALPFDSLAMMSTIRCPAILTFALHCGYQFLLKLAKRIAEILFRESTDREAVCNGLSGLAKDEQMKKRQALACLFSKYSQLGLH
jgi:hypothetical protein